MGPAWLCSAVLNVLGTLGLPCWEPVCICQEGTVSRLGQQGDTVTLGPYCVALSVHTEAAVIRQEALTPGRVTPLLGGLAAHPLASGSTRK